ncbi:MAG: radical SAM protein, partial [Oscillospiraceae bacterium]
AQDTTRYGEDLYGRAELSRLLRELCRLDFKWIRLLYCYPERITDELIDVIAKEDKIVKYIDIPIQHVNENILKRMNRSGNEQTIRELIGKLRYKIPDIVIRTTLIAGFPGETDEQFEQLAEFVMDMRFERLGCFSYSAEEGTPAAEFENQVELKVREHRADIIMDQQLTVMDDINSSQIGKDIEVVVEGFDRYAECYFGRSYADAPEIDGKIFFDSNNKLNTGQFVTVHIDDVLDYDLIGAVADESAE